MSKRIEMAGMGVAMVAALVVGAVSGAWAAGGPDDPVPGSSYYTVHPIFNPFPSDVKFSKGWGIQNFGPVGIGITLGKPVFTMTINNVEKGSPAEAVGTLKKGQIIESINGRTLKDIDPRVILGDIITEAEATDGLIKLAIKAEGEVTVKIPVLGRYSETWPLNCPKSDRIVRNLADLLAKQDKPRWGSVLFLLSTGEQKDVEVVRKWMQGIQTIGAYPWHKGYLGPGLCEYYLRTGDEHVLPVIKQMTEELKVLMYNGGWSGRGHANFTYSTGTGQMNAAGVHCVTFLLLAKMCGVDVDEHTLQRSLMQFYRFAGHGNVPYGDGLPEGGFRDNGKTGGLAVAMAVAARLTPEGEKSIYAEARDNAAMKSFYATNWFHSAHTGGGIGEIWHNAAMGLMPERRPVQYRSFMDQRRWVMELSRRFDGSIGIAGVVDRYDRSASESERAWGTYFALAYTLPRKKLQLCGAPRTKWCRTYQLPERPWGTAADDILVSNEPAEHGFITVQDLLKERVPTDSSAPVLRRIGDPDVSDEVLLKYVHHPEFGLRCAAMRTIVAGGRKHLVLPLLKSEDPRIRHAGILAITGMFKGRPLPAADVTPEMFELLGGMINDPDESLWVAQAAMRGLKRAEPNVIAQHKARLLQFLKRDDWILQSAAVEALTPLAVDEAHYREVLPSVIGTIGRFTTAQGLNAGWELSKRLNSAGPEVKAFAVEQFRKAYASVPDELVMPGGHVIDGGSESVRKSLRGMMAKLPGGTDLDRQAGE